MTDTERSVRANRVVLWMKVKHWKYTAWGFVYPLLTIAAQRVHDGGAFSVGESVTKTGEALWLLGIGGTVLIGFFALQGRIRDHSVLQNHFHGGRTSGPKQ